MCRCGASSRHWQAILGCANMAKTCACQIHMVRRHFYYRLVKPIYNFASGLSELRNVYFVKLEVTISTHWSINILFYLKWFDQNVLLQLEWVKEVQQVSWKLLKGYFSESDLINRLLFSDIEFYIYNIISIIIINSLVITTYFHKIPILCEALIFTSVCAMQNVFVNVSTFVIELVKCVSPWWS